MKKNYPFVIPSAAKNLRPLACCLLLAAFCLLPFSAKALLWKGTQTFNSDVTITDNIDIQSDILNPEVWIVVNNGATVTIKGKIYDWDCDVPFRKKGNGTLVLANPDNKFTSVIYVEQGNLRFGDGITNGNLININQPIFVHSGCDLEFKTVPGTTVTINSNIYGKGGIYKFGTEGTVILSDCEISGRVSVQGGILQMNDNFNLPSYYGVGAGATLRFQVVGNKHFSKVISGGGNFEKTGPADLTFTANQTYTGNTIISQGNLGLGGATPNGIVAGNIINNGALFFNCNTDKTIYGSISGTGGFDKWSPGKLTLLGTNTYSGVTKVWGTLQIGNGMMGSLANSNVQLMDANAQLNLVPGADMTFNKVISGSGSLEFTGINDNRLFLTGENTYTGETSIVGGLYVGNGVSGSINKTSKVVMKVNASLNFEPGQNTVFPGTISGVGTVTYKGTDNKKLFLTADNTFYGLTKILSGSLSLGNGTPNGNLTGDILRDNGQLIFATTDNKIYSGIISGNGSVRKVCTGKTTLTGNNTYTGETVIENGTLQIGNGTSGSVNSTSHVAIQEANAILRLEPGGGGDKFFPQVISGPGKVEYNGTAVTSLAFTGNNTYTGATTIEAGKLYVGAASTTGAIAGNIIVNNNAFLGFHRSNEHTYSKVISGAGTVENYGGKSILTGANTYTGKTRVVGGTLQVGNRSSGSIQTTSNVELVSNSSVLRFEPSGFMIFSKVISGPGKVEFKGSYSRCLCFTANNTYTDTTTIEAGDFYIGDYSTEGAVAGNIINNGELFFYRNNSYTYNGVISGSGNVFILSGIITLGGVNTYTGTTQINGTVILNSSGSIENSNQVHLGGVSCVLDISSGDKTIKSLRNFSTFTTSTVKLGNKTLTINMNDSDPFVGNFTGTNGNVIKTGTGTLTLTNNANTATGTFTCNEGAVKLSGNWAGNLINNANSTLEITGNVTIGKNLTLNGGAIAMNTKAGSFSKISVTGSVAATGTNTLNITTGEVTNYMLIQAASGITSIDPYTLYMPGMSGTLSVISPTQLLLSAEVQDVIKPVAGSSGIITGTTTGNQAQLSWTAATDDKTPQEQLRYFVYQSSSNNISTVDACEANGTLLNFGGTINITTFTASDLEPLVNYYFNVVVADMAGNKTAYVSKMLTTEKPLLSGEVYITTLLTGPVFGATLMVYKTLQPDPFIEDMGTLTYQWKRDGANIGDNSDHYLVVEADIAHTITVTVTASNCIGSLTSYGTFVLKAPQEAPKPQMESRTSTRITLVAVDGCLYRINGGLWQNSPVFSGLEPGTIYGFETKKTETNTHTAAVSILSLFSTEKAAPQIVGISISPKSIAVPPEQTQQFEAIVIAVGDADESVTWSVEGNTSEQTTITSNGLLTVGSDETGGIIIVRVTSNVAPTIFEEAIVYIREVGIVSPTLNTKIVVYPNPTTGELRISNGACPIVNVELYDVYGRRIEIPRFARNDGGGKFPSNSLEGWQPQADGVVFNIANLPAGIYFLRIQTDQGVVVVR
jgi:autotransporter-associated beta strand protein